ncbi:tetracycline-efflux transporter [Anaeramoeba flamelloides]|uniref:Tetracycline-efflux transporter n=1 Tax=Anaeramoeba flamelloides TaxID=1746091 RepID=A0ABQ8Y8N2_9EUKA|nr:tetracycline-efflux transporter [Anaeramoeba flamelloides]
MFFFLQLLKTIGLTTVSFASFFTDDFYEGKNIPAASELFGLCETAFYLLQLLGNPFFGVFSDRFGRKNSILVILLGGSLNWFILSQSTTKIMVIFARMMHGFCDSNSQATASYVSDISSKQDFPKNMGLLQGTGGFGMIVGLILGFILNGVGLSNRNMFFVAATILGFNAFYVYFILPESMKTAKLKRFDWAKANPLGSIKFIYNNKKFRRMFPILYFNIIGGTCGIILLQFYLRYKHKMSEKLIYILLFEAAILQIFAMAVLLRLSIKKKGNKRTLIDGFLAQLGLNICCIIAPKGWMFFFFIPLVYQFVAFTIIQSFFQAVVKENEKGMLFGALSLGSNFAHTCAKFMYPRIFSFSTRNFDFPELPFIIALFFSFVNLYLASKIPEQEYFEKKDDDQDKI